MVNLRGLLCLMSLAIVVVPEGIRAQEPAAPPEAQSQDPTPDLAATPEPSEEPSPEPSPEASPTPEPEAALQGESEAPSPGAHVIALSEAVAIALERNFGMLSAGDSLVSSRYREQASRAQFYPRLTPRYQRNQDVSAYGLDASQRLPYTGGTASVAGTVQSIDASATSPAGKSSDLRAIVSQPLLRGFGPNATYFDLRNSERARVGQERSYELARQRLAIDVTAAFYQIVKQRALLGVSRQSLKRSSGNRQASEARMKVGLASKLDVLRAELQASQTEDSLVQSRALLDNALESFRLLLGLSPSDPLEPETLKLPEDLAASDLEPTEVLVARALDTRLDLKETRDQVKDAERSLALARQSLLPQLDLTLSLAKTGFGPSFGNALDAGDTRVSLSLSSSYPLEHSSDKANKAIAQLELDSRKRTLARREMEIEAEVRSAVRQLERIRKSIELQKKSVEVSEQQLRLATLRYQRGLASNFDVVDAEGNLVSVRSALVGLLTDYQVARVDLLRVVGTLDVAKEFQP